MTFLWRSGVGFWEAEGINWLLRVEVVGECLRVDMLDAT